MNTNKPVNELIDIHIACCVHWNIEADEFMHHVEQVAKLVYLLKNKGCNSRIYYYIEGTYGSAKIKVKDFRDTLDLRKLILVEMPDFFRRYGFLLFELDPKLQEGYGHVDKSYFDKWRKQFSKNVLNIDLMRFDSMGIRDKLLEAVARERDIKKVVKLVNSSLW